GGAFGAHVAGIPDLDGDGFGDLAVGAPAEYEDIDIWQSGRVHVYSGATGTLLYSLDSPNPDVQGHFGLAVAGVEDLDGDGRGEILVGAAFENGWRGNAYLFSGATGELLRTLTSPSDGIAAFGAAVTALPDA